MQPQPERASTSPSTPYRASPPFPATAPREPTSRRLWWLGVAAILGLFSLARWHAAVLERATSQRSTLSSRPPPPRVKVLPTPCDLRAQGTRLRSYRTWFQDGPVSSGFDLDSAGHYRRRHSNGSYNGLTMSDEGCWDGANVEAHFDALEALLRDFDAPESGGQPGYRLDLDYRWRDGRTTRRSHHTPFSALEHAAWRFTEELPMFKPATADPPACPSDQDWCVLRFADYGAPDRSTHGRQWPARYDAWIATDGRWSCLRHSNELGYHLVGGAIAPEDARVLFAWLLAPLKRAHLHRAPVGERILPNDRQNYGPYGSIAHYEHYERYERRDGVELQHGADQFAGPLDEASIDAAFAAWSQVAGQLSSDCMP